MAGQFLACAAVQLSLLCTDSHHPPPAGDTPLVAGGSQPARSHVVEQERQTLQITTKDGPQ